MSEKKTNLLFVFSDQHRKFDLGCYGNEEVMTPNMDALAARGARFEHLCSNAPVCVPARGSLLTGLHAQHHGAYTNDLAIRYDVESIADALNRAGYHTGYIGKWHLCGVPRDQYIDKDRRLGFTEWKVANCNHNYLKCYYDDEENVRHCPEGYEPEIFGDLACEFLERNVDKDQPFALFLSFAAPHDPHNLVGEEYKEMYRNRPVTLRDNAPDRIMVNMDHYITKEQQIEMKRGYYGHITAIDRQLGHLMDILKQHGQLDNTLIVYTADHGDMLGSHGMRDKQLPHEESMGVPLIISLKDQIPAGVRDGLISSVDLPVTLTSFLNAPFESHTDGRDLSGLLRGTDDGAEDCYLYDMFPCHQAYDKGMWAWRGIRTKRYTYATYGDGRDWLLFDNETDPGQMHNLVNDPALSAVKADLRARLDKYVSENDAYVNGYEYIRFSNRVDDFNESQIYFNRPTLEQMEETEARHERPKNPLL